MAYLYSYKKIALSITLSLAGMLLTLPARAQVAEETSLPVDLSPQVHEQVASLQAWKQSLSPTQRKIQTALLVAAKINRGEAITPKVKILRSIVKVEPFDRVAVEIKATVTPELVRVLRASGATITAIPRKKTVVYAKVGLQQLEALASRSDITRINYLMPPVTDGVGAQPPIGNIGSGPNDGDGIVVSEGLYSHGVKSVHLNSKTRDGEPIRGQNVRVGVISDSNDYAENSLASLDIPANTEVLIDDFGFFLDGRPGSGEGTAMMEIVHDLAPDSDIVFSTGGGGEEAFAQNILDLRFKMGCDVIVDDLSYLTESAFQDGPIAQAVAAVRADGCLYFSSAGNSGSKAFNTSSVWEGDFRRGGTLNGFPVNRFGNNIFNQNRGALTYALLSWSDALSQSNNDYDLYAIDSTGTTILDFSVDFQTGTQDPFEALITFPGDLLVVQQYNGTNIAQDRFLRLEAYRSSGLLSATTNGNITGHHGAVDDLSVAAAEANNIFPYPLFTAGKSVESFTSDGPRRQFYNPDGTAIAPGNFLVRTGGGTLINKPDFTAADGVITTVPGFNIDPDPFYGTSAAAPHAAAIAALVKSANVDIPNDEILRLMRETGFDIMDFGYDFLSGHGLVMGAAADAVTNFLEKPAVTSITDTTATITWKSKSPVETFLEYGPTVTYGSVSSDGTEIYTHSVMLTGLTPGTNYNFRLKGTYLGFTQTSQNYTFRTTGGSVPILTIDGVLLTRDLRTNSLIATITIKNTTGGIAKNVILDRAALGISSPIPNSQLPISLGDIAVGANKTFTVRFGSQRSGTTPLLRLTGKMTGGLTPTFSLTYQTLVP
jgi:hypothetical protein